MFEKIVTPVLAIAEVKSVLMKVAGSHKYWRNIHAPEMYGKMHPPDPHPRSIKDSFSRGIIEISKAEVREQYINSLNQIRTGRLLEDLDCFAGYVAFKHNNVIQNDKVLRAGFSVVTASIDRMLVHNPPLLNADIHISGYVSHVGRSSMETTLSMDQHDKSGTRPLMKARFVMVAIDPQLRSPTPVSPLVPADDIEKAIKEQGAKHRKRREKMDANSLFRHPPDEEESVLIHDLYLQTLDPSRHSFQGRFKPSDDVWMKDTSMKSIVICHPQNRNVHNQIFGGFLIRTALELAWAEAWAFSKAWPYLVAVDDIVFRRPVEIGSLLWLHQSIGYTDGDLIQSRVTAEVGDVNDPNRREISNIFHLTFRAPLGSERGALPRIIPDSYGEGMLFLDSRRRLASIKESLTPSVLNFTHPTA